MNLFNLDKKLEFTTVLLVVKNINLLKLKKEIIYFQITLLIILTEV
jgi:hypothetical protein